MVNKEWTDKFQYKFLKFNIKFTITAATFLGLWPFIFDRNRMVFKTNAFLKYYTLFAFLFQFCCFSISGRLLTNKYHIEWRSETSKIIINCFGSIFLLCFITAYKQQLTNYNKIKLIALTGQQFWNKIKQDLDLSQSSYIPFLLIYFFVNCVLSVLTVIVAIQKLHLITNPTSNIFSYLYIFIALPYWTISVPANIFFGAVLLGYFVLIELNKVLQNIIESAIDINMSDSKRCHQMQRYCELSDKLDNLTVIYFEFCTLLRNINNFFSYPLLSYLTYRTISIIYQAFFVYIYFSITINNIGGAPNQLLLANIESLAIFSLQLFVITGICTRLNIEV